MDYCVACSNTELVHIGYAPIIDPHLNDRFQIRECSKCSHWSTNPTPSRDLLGQLYAKASLSVLGEGSATNYASGNIKSTISSDENWVVKKLASRPVGNFLEIGPGDGSLIRKFRELGWVAYGVDPGQYLKDEKIVDSAKVLPAGIKFDVIVLQDILEHTSNPWEELAQYQVLLKQNARVFMTFPWSQSAEAKKLGSNWTMVRPIGHLHYFSKESAVMLMNSIGAQIAEVNVINLMPSKIRRIKNLIWLLGTFPLQFARRKVRKNPYRHRLALLYQSWVSFRSEGDQLYVEGVLK
jgi:hypothetical protein